MSHNPCVKTGAYVLVENYGASAPADLFLVGGALLVRFPGPWEQCCTYGGEARALRRIDTRVRLGPGSLWRADLGFALVPVADADWRGGGACPWREGDRLRDAARELAGQLTGPELSDLRDLCDYELARMAEMKAVCQ